MTPAEESAKELQFYRDKYQVPHSTGDLTPTVCRLFGARKPSCCGAEEIAGVVDQAYRLMGGDGRAEKVLVFSPDAVGEVHAGRFPEAFERVERLAGFRILSAAVMPSVTPVCFATIFSGASPAVHGIRKYAKPVLKIETLFDVLAEAGKNVAIVCCNSCSIDMIFRGRNIDYYSFRTDRAAFEMTRKLIADSDYDFILCYMAGYDHISHHAGPWAEESVRELMTAIGRFEQLAADADEHWGAFNRAVIWAPDHGNHQIDAETGGHGDDIPDDMLVNHFYRVRGARR
ncbi:MAG: hypothetical protein HPZ91_18790 [Lentisphaeria bacterium]|nr:hypothetical protein [Lentisphaeria bacterium]